MLICEANEIFLVGLMLLPIVVISDFCFYSFALLIILKNLYNGGNIFRNISYAGILVARSFHVA